MLSRRAGRRSASSRAGCRREERCRSSPACSCRSQDGSLELAATDMELSLRDEARGERGRRGLRGRAGPPAHRHRAPSARGGGRRSSIASRRARSYVSSGSSESRLRTYAVEDFPRLPDIDLAALSTLEAEPLLETIARVSRAASRDESRPVLTGHPRPLRGVEPVMAATDSYRMAVKETAVERRRAGARRHRPCARPRRAAPHRRGGERDPAGHARQPRRHRRRRHLADDPPDRRAVPELQAAAPGGVRARGQAAARGVPGRHPPRRRDGPALDAAPAPLRGRRADRHGADPGHRRGARADAGRVQRRAARDRLQPDSGSATASIPSSRTSSRSS